MKNLTVILLASLCSFSALALSFIQSEVIATSTSSKILNEDSSRSYLLIQNKGSDDLYVKIDSVHSGSEGIKIPAGGNWEPFKAPTNEIWVKSASNPDTLSVVIGR